MGRILVVGSLNMDTTIALPHIPVVGETVLADNSHVNPGGKGANQAYAIGKLGGNVGMLGAIGNDKFGEVLTCNLRDACVDVSGLVTKTGVSTGNAIIYVNEQGDNCIVVIQGANAMLSVKNVQWHSDMIMESDIVILQMEIPMDTISYVIHTAAKAGKKVILDPAPAVSDFPKELYPYIDIIKPNETELGILLNNPNAVGNITASARQLREYGVKNVVVTLGKQGAYVDSDECVKGIVPSYAAKTVDTTAAGDTFIAAMAVKLAEGAALMDAVDYGNLVSSIVVSRKGAQSSIPTRAEMDSIIALNN